MHIYTREGDASDDTTSGDCLTLGEKVVARACKTQCLLWHSLAPTELDTANVNGKTIRQTQWCSVS